MRLMSFALTTPQFYARLKDVTRRLGWEDLVPGELLCGIVKGRVSDPTRLAVIRVKSTRREALNRITRAEVAREGFPGMGVGEFVDMFRESHESCAASDPVTRIEYQFIPGGRYVVPGFCRVCGCSEFMACEPNIYGHTCSWVDDRGNVVSRPSTLCSRCYPSISAAGLPLVL